MIPQGWLIWIGIHMARVPVFMWVLSGVFAGLVALNIRIVSKGNGSSFPG